MTTKHTPGPWKLEAGRKICTSSGDFYLTYHRDEYSGTAMFRSFTELDRNAQLCAAAPAMLDTLLAIRARIKGEWDAPELVAKGVQYFQADVDVLRWIDDVLKEATP